MTRVDATMAVKLAVLGMHFIPLATLLGAMGIGRLQISLMRVGAEHYSSR
jgi:hypothetical protein